MILGSKIRDPEKTYPGSMGQKGTGSATLYLTACLLTFERFKMKQLQKFVQVAVPWIRIFACYFSKIHLHNSSNIKSH
jgi:hypothetical protein